MNRFTCCISDILKNFSGVNITYGYMIYQRLGSKHGNLINGDNWMHTRHPFTDSIKLLKDSANDMIGSH